MLKTGFLLAVLFMTGCARSCSSKAPSPEELSPKQKSVLKVQLHAEPVSLDPAFAEDGLALKLITQLRDGLVGYDGEGKLQLLLAESYQVSPDGKRFEFRLKPDLKWSDGRPVMVQDFVFGIRRSLTPGTGGKLVEQLMPIRGARAFRAGKLKAAMTPEDRTVGVFEENGKLVIELEEPAPYFLQALTLPSALPVRRDILAEQGGKWTEDKAPGTGAYRFAAYQPGKRFLIEANPYYWGEKPTIRLIDFLFVLDESTALNLFESGQLDIVTRVPAGDAARLKKNGALRTDPFFATYFIAFNTRKAPFNDREFRRAVAGSIRRDQITEILETGEMPARSWIPRGLEGFIPYEDPAPVFEKSVKAVREQLTRKPLGAVAASFDSSSRNALVMEKVQQDLRDHLGLKISLSNLDWKSYVKSLQTDPTPLYRFGWLAPFADPINPLQAFLSGSPNNHTGWKNAEYDRVVREIAEMPSGPAREAKVRRAQQILVDEEAVVVPLYHYVQNHLVSGRVSGFKVNPFGVIPFGKLRYSESASP